MWEALHNYILWQSGWGLLLTVLQHINGMHTMPGSAVTQPLVHLEASTGHRSHNMYCMHKPTYQYIHSSNKQECQECTSQWGKLCSSDKAGVITNSRNIFRQETAIKYSSSNLVLLFQYCLNDLDLHSVLIFQAFLESLWTAPRETMNTLQSVLQLERQ